MFKSIIRYLKTQKVTHLLNLCNNCDDATLATTAAPKFSGLEKVLKKRKRWLILTRLSNLLTISITLK